MFKESETSYSKLVGNTLTTESTSKMPDDIFGEGICTLPGESSFVRMTWKDDIVDILDSNLKILETRSMFSDVKQGWGITRDEEILYVTDGSENVYIVNAKTFETERSFKVTMPNGKIVTYLNELEFINGLIWANVFTTNDVIAIDP